MEQNLLKSFVPQRPIPVSKQNKIIFCGAGDSFVSALIAHVFSNSRAQAFDPYDLLGTKKILSGKNLYLISVSGNTISNINLARTHRKTTAVTADNKSRLARHSKDLILLRFEKTGIQTAGSISFLASMLTCVSLVTRFSLRGFCNLYSSAKKTAKKISLQGKVFVLGNYTSFPVAIYCAAKLYEVLGIDAQYERIEEFSHMELFSCRPGDTVIIFEKKNRYNQKLFSVLKKYGLNVILISPPTKCHLAQVLFFVFVSQFLALSSAKKKRKKDCFFVEEKKLRNISSDMIY